MSSMTTPAINPNAPHAFKTSSGLAYLRDRTGTLVTEARFHDHRRALSAIANSLARGKFGWEALTFKLEPITAAGGHDFEARR